MSLQTNLFAMALAISTMAHLALAAFLNLPRSEPKIAGGEVLGTATLGTEFRDFVSGVADGVIAPLDWAASSAPASVTPQIITIESVKPVLSVEMLTHSAAVESLKARSGSDVVPANIKTLDVGRYVPTKPVNSPVFDGASLAPVSALVSPETVIAETIQPHTVQQNLVVVAQPKTVPERRQKIGLVTARPRQHPVKQGSKTEAVSVTQNPVLIGHVTVIPLRATPGLELVQARTGGLDVAGHVPPKPTNSPIFSGAGLIPVSSPVGLQTLASKPSQTLTKRKTLAAVPQPKPVSERPQKFNLVAVRPTQLLEKREIKIEPISSTQKPVSTQATTVLRPERLAARGNAQIDAHRGQTDGQLIAQKSRASDVGQSNAEQAGEGAIVRYKAKVRRRVDNTPAGNVGAWGNAEITLEIAPQGRIVGTRVALTSGNARVDNAAQKLVARSGPFGPTPTGRKVIFKIRVEVKG